jgi:hypothetical protein
VEYVRPILTATVAARVSEADKRLLEAAVAIRGAQSLSAYIAEVAPKLRGGISSDGALRILTTVRRAPRGISLAMNGSTEHPAGLRQYDSVDRAEVPLV